MNRVPPKTLHLTNFFHAASGGISAFYRALFAHANRVGREMRLVAPAEQSGCEPVGALGRLYTVRAPRSPWIDSRYRILFPIGANGREVAAILRAEQPRILEVSDKYSMPYVSGMVRKNMIRGVLRPTEIATSHERLDDNVAAHVDPGGLGRRFARWYMRRIYFAQFDHHIANSEYTASELAPASVGHTTRRGVWVCPMGVDADYFTPGSDERAPGMRLLYAGRLAREKNVTLLLDTLAALPPEFSLEVAGDGPEREAFGRRARQRFGHRVVMRGFIASRDEYRELLRSTDVFVHPNPREPFGIGPLEAMACGVPVVAPDSGGVLAYASARNAWLSPAAPEPFARAVRDVLSDEGVRRRKCREARATAEQHNWSIVAARFFELLDTLHFAGFAGLSVAPIGAAIDAWTRQRSAVQTACVARVHS